MPGWRSSKNRSARCVPCDLNYYPDRKLCLICRGDLDKSELEPDADLGEKLERLQALRRQELNGGKINNARVVTVEHNGRLWVADSLLRRYGYTPQDLDIVLINDTYYELVGRVANKEISGWLLEEIDPDAEVAQLTEQHPVLTETEYQALERQRGIRE